MTLSSRSGSHLARAVLASAVLLGAANASFAQEAYGEARAEFHIEAGNLHRALDQLARQSGIQLLYDASLAKGRTVAAFDGTTSVRGVLDALLAGSGLEYQFTDASMVVIKPAKGGSSTDGARSLGPVRVQGAEIAGVAGINGSSDPTATEGTKSYTSSALGIASKMPQSIKDTPQSVSVVTQQRMQDQNLTDFASVMNQATGITLVTTSSLESTFYSRGFAIDRIQIDGGAPLSTSFSINNGFGSGYSPQIDMAQYDHVEILRGAAGLFNGYGTPSGSVNLARKRPLDHGQVVVEGQTGSWSNNRMVVDSTAPLGLDGKLRGRAVMSYQDQDYFYDTASKNHTLAYSIVEADLTPSTVISAGFSFTRQEAVPWSTGLPRYQGGADLQLPRSSSLVLPWSVNNRETKEIFAQVKHDFTDDWSFNLNLTHSDQESYSKYGYVYGTVNPAAGIRSTLRGSMFDASSAQMLADFTVNGTFELFGNLQSIVFGGNWQDADSSGQRTYGALYSSPYPAVDVFDFDTTDPAFREPGASESDTYYREFGQKQWGAYANVRLTLWKPLHLITGLRYSDYEYTNVTEFLCTSAYVASGFAGCAAPGQVYGVQRGVYPDHDISWPPKVSLVYDLSEDWSAYVSYTDIYQVQSNYMDTERKPLDPMTGSNFEAGVKIEGLAGRFNASFAAYRIEQKNKYALEVQGVGANGVPCCYINGNQINLSRGVDAEITGELLPGWQLFAGYTYNLNQIKGSDAGTTEGEALVSLVPKHLLKLWTSYQLQQSEWLKRLSVGGGVNAQTRSYTSGNACVAWNYDESGNPTKCKTRAEGGLVDYDYTQGFYAVFSGRLAYQIDAHWNAALNVNNIADRTYYRTMGTNNSGNWYGEPRSFMLTLRGTF